MLTKVLKIDSKKNQDFAIKEAAKILETGGIVAFPTETVYGLGGDATNPTSAKKIYEAKGRPSDNPLIVHIADVGMIEDIAYGFEKTIVEQLSKKFWPGPLTIILKKRERIPFETTGGLDTVAIRMPDNEVTRMVIKAFGKPVAAPSANISGRPSPTTASHVFEDFEGKIDCVIDDGSCDIGIESTILDLTSKKPVILRKGFIKAKDIENAIGTKIDSGPGKSEVDKPKAPGMKYKHYAPKGMLTVVFGKEKNQIEYINSSLKKSLWENKACGVICCKEHIEYYNGLKTYDIGSKYSGEEIMKNLYKILRELDRDGIDVCYCEGFEENEFEDVINERLMKASGNNIVRV